MTSPASASSAIPRDQVLRSPLLEQAGFRHAFFTRRGGTSSGPYASLNFSTLPGDDPQAVQANFALAAQFLQVTPERLYWLTQVHGKRCVSLQGSESASEVHGWEGDALLTRAPRTACAIRTADCIPLLFGCRRTGWVAACHAGWRGLAQQIIQATIDSLREQGAHELCVAVGPHISRNAFEVSQEVADTLLALSPDPHIIEQGPHRPHVDLRRLAHAQLLQAGLREEEIDHVPGCTVSSPELFYSYRRDGAASGRLLSAIVTRDNSPEAL